MIQEVYNNPFVTKADFDSLKKTTEDGFICADDKFIKIDRKFDHMTEAMMGNFDRVYKKFDRIDKRFDSLDNDMKLIKKRLGVKDATISA